MATNERPYKVTVTSVTDFYGKKYVSFQIHDYPYDVGIPVMHGFSEQELFDKMVHAYIEAENGK